MTAPAAGLARRYAAWSLDALALCAIALAVTWPRVRAAWAALTDATHALSQRLGEQLGTLVMQAPGDPNALAAQLLADPQVKAGADAVQAALLGLLLPPVLAYACFGLAYHVGGQASRWQGSPAQRALGLTVARADGSRAGPLRLVVRYVAASLSWLTANLGHALALVAPHRTLHDRLTDTAVFQRDAGRLPAWARAWLALQALAVVVVLVVGLQRYVALLQAALG